MADWITSLRLCGLSLVVCSTLYPLVVLGFASVVAPEARQGNLVHAADGMVVGSRLLAQGFTRPEYFWPRPSAVDYNASATGGSNLSPANPKLTERAEEIIARHQLSTDQQIPADLVAASGSGMDPHITRNAALFQVPRVVQARQISKERVKELVEQHLDSGTLQSLGGESLVNVLELNLALDSLAAETR